MTRYSTLDELPGWARSLLAAEPVARLGVIDRQGNPRVLPITFVVAGGSIWSTVDQKPKRAPVSELARISWLRERPQAAITVDHYEHDWTRLAWVQVLGIAAIVAIDCHEPVRAALTHRYPTYRESPPPGPLIELKPQRIVTWRATGGHSDS